ncbi:MAG: tRNA (adenosine(37)-N6)-threonylcarbamoyltransferase complex dimerization subunit type 1 TsaB [Saccharofermentanales bacterium]
MIILASDTTTKSLSAAILRDGEILFSHTEETGSTHSQRLMPLILKTLKDSGLTFADVDLFVCTAGPGSYTGIRINVATVKAIAYASGKAAAGVSTLETLAFPHRTEDTLICPLIDARNRRAFSAAYIGKTLVMKEDNYSMDDICRNITELAGSPVRRIVFCGDAAVKYSTDTAVMESLSKISGQSPGIIVEFVGTVPQAADAAKLARLLVDGGNLQLDPFLLEPRYISPSQAERMKPKGRSVPAFTVRAAEPADLEGVYRLETECFAIPWTEESLRRDIVDNDFAQYFVALAEGRIAGYIGIYYSYEDAQITNLAVAADLRGKGIGHMLVKQALHYCASKGCERVTLEVRTGNSRAIALYSSEGFGIAGIRKGYYADNGEDAIIMLKNIV